MLYRLRSETKLSIIDLYIRPITDEPITKVFPPERQAQIDSVKNENLRRQRYFVWKLLEHGIKQSLGLDFQEINFSLDKSGKWSCDKCFFSLSHTENAVAVAISSKPVGVDIECCDRIISEKVSKKILIPSELDEFARIPKIEQSQYLLQKWTAKECLFKVQNHKYFKPELLNCENRVITNQISLNNKTYFYSVTAEKGDVLRINY